MFIKNTPNELADENLYVYALFTLYPRFLVKLGTTLARGLRGLLLTLLWQKYDLWVEINKTFKQNSEDFLLLQSSFLE